MAAARSPAGRLAGRRVGVVGMARSGVAAARLALRRGGRPFVSDAAPLARVAAAASELQAAGIPFETGGHGERVLDVDLLVTSPGVPFGAPILERARARGVPVVPELELAAEACAARVAAITGSNGKTTTTALTAALLSGAGVRAVACGNIGLAFSAVADDLGPDDVAVVECSSFQLEATVAFRPRVAVVLNLQPDHLDRHGSMEAYARAKMRITAHQDESDVLILGDGVDVGPYGGTRARVLRFSGGAPGASTGASAGPHAYVEDGRLRLRTEWGTVDVLAVDAMRLAGRHNRANAAAACLVATCLGARPEALGPALAAFAPLPHRLEPVCSVAGVAYVNDSKATNVDAACVALDAVRPPVVLILGGRPKGEPFAPIAEAGRGRVRLVLAIGEAAPRIAAELGSSLPVEVPGDLASAVAAAHAAARPGDTVLLAPACASFDQFTSYEHRGEAFRELVCALPGAAPIGADAAARPEVTP